MKKFLVLMTMVLGVSAHAANKYPFVNSQYIDENTSFATIARTQGYQIKSPVQYSVNGVVVDGLQTCQMNGKLYAPISTPIFGNNSEAGVVGSTLSLVAIPAVQTASVCEFNTGSEGGCEPKLVSKAQALHTSFPVQVLAIQSTGDQGSVVSYWGVAFTKMFVAPACK